MKKSIQCIAAVFLIAIIATACGSNTHSGDAANLQLDNGTKWKANSETTQGINSMITMIDRFNESGDNGEYSNLKADLESEYKLIFKNCTMTGAAHDQLHSYLMPLKDIIDQLEEPQPETILLLDDHLQMYFEYFE
jgi:uncharacterized protein YxeA